MSDESPWWVHDRQDAVEFLTMVIEGRDAKRGGRTPDESDETVTLPLNIARLVLAAARSGMHKGDGKRGVPLTHSERDRRGGMMLWANAKKTELFDAAMREYEKNGGVPPTMSGCKHLAAQWALEKFRLNLALSTIKRAMGPL